MSTSFFSGKFLKSEIIGLKNMQCLKGFDLKKKSSGGLWKYTSILSEINYEKDH